MDEFEETLEERFEHLAQELKDRGIQRQFWADIQEQAENCKSVEELDKYLDKMEAEFNEFR